MRRHMHLLGTVTLLLAALGGCAQNGNGDGGRASDDAASALTDAVMESVTLGGLERHARAIVQYERPISA